MIMKCIAIAFCMLTGFSVFAQDVSSQKTVRIEPFLTLSYGAFFKTLVLESPDCSIEHLSDFTFEWGYRYELKVREIVLEYLPMDGSNVAYELLKVVSKERVASDYTFKLMLENDQYLGPGEQLSSFTLINDSTYRYFDKVDLVIPKDLQVSFQKVILPASSLQGEFEIMDEQTIRLLKLL